MFNKIETSILGVMVENGFIDNVEKTFNIPTNYSYVDLWKDVVFLTEKKIVSAHKAELAAKEGAITVRSFFRKCRFLKSEYNVNGQVMTGEVIFKEILKGKDPQEIRDYIADLNANHCVKAAYVINDEIFTPRVKVSQNIQEKNKAYAERMQKQVETKTHNVELQLWIKKENEWLCWERFDSYDKLAVEAGRLRSEGIKYNIGGPLFEEVITEKQKERKVKAERKVELQDYSLFL